MSRECFHVHRVQPENNRERIKNRHLLLPTTLLSLNWNRLAHKRDGLWGLVIYQTRRFKSRPRSVLEVRVGGWWPWDLHFAVKNQGFEAACTESSRALSRIDSPRLFTFLHSGTNNLSVKLRLGFFFFFRQESNAQSFYYSVGQNGSSDLLGEAREGAGVYYCITYDREPVRELCWGTCGHLTL